MAEAPFIGVQLGPHSVFDEGRDRVLDLLQNLAAVNAVLVYSHTYQRFDRRRPREGLADHGVEVRHPSRRRMTLAWVPPHDEYYGGTILRHRRRPGEEEYADRDVFADLVEPVRDRGMKLFARILEGHGPHLAALVPNWSKVLSVDVHGRRHHLPCWNNPDYRAWWISTVEDLFQSYPLDGFMWGAERSGPLPSLLCAGTPPGCFCEHCQSRGRSLGIDVQRARDGFRQLETFVGDCRNGGEPPADGRLVTFLRILLRYPEILRWEYAWHEAKEGLAREMYGAVKALSPEAQVGWHVYHPVTWDPIYRAEMDYAEIATYADWIKPVVYHDIAGVRIRERYVMPLVHGVLGDIPGQDLLQLLYRVLGYDPEVEAGLDALTTSGMSSDYVFSEVRRCVKRAGNVPVYAGVGFDVPTDGNPIQSDATRTYEATRRAFEAGARGLIVSREYDEMRIENLEAVGRAVREEIASSLASSSSGLRQTGG